MKPKKIVPTKPRLSWIFRLRKKLNLTQAQFADRVGVYIRTVQDWESKKNPRYPHGLALKALKQLQADAEVL